MSALPSDIPWPRLVRQSALILESYRFWFKQALVPAHGSLEDQALRLFDLPSVILSSGNEPDPLLNYGNRQALTLWETDWEHLCGLPGRLTAEPMEQTARDNFLKRVRENGFVTDYEGIRISRRGKRFWISQATVWNILGPQGKFLGQAAAFNSWKPL